MKKYIPFLWIMLCTAPIAGAQPDFYTDAFLGLPEFRALVLRLPTSDPDSARVVVHVRIVYDDLQFVKKGDIYQAGYGLDVILRDKNETLVGDQHIERQVEVTTYSTTNSRQQGDQTRAQFTIKPESYNLRIFLVDRESRKSRFMEQELDFPDKEWTQTLRLGDPVLLDSTGSAYMVSGLLQGQPLRMAYQLYSSKTEELSLIYQLRDGSEQITDQKPLPLTGGGPLFADTLVIPTDSLTNQSYHLILMARQGKTTLTRSYPFKILTHNLPDYIQDLTQAIRQLRYIATDEEYNQLRSAPPAKQEELFSQFWKKKDPTPSTPINEKMDEYYRRVRYANEKFSGHRDGWESDMGRVFIIFGPPSSVERHPFDIDAKPHEIWYYYDLNRSFLFVDEEGFGEYRLKSPFWDEY